MTPKDINEKPAAGGKMEFSSTGDFQDSFLQEPEVFLSQNLLEKLQDLKSIHRQRLLELGMLYHRELQHKMKEAGNMKVHKANEDLESFFASSVRPVLQSSSKHQSPKKHTLMRKSFSVTDLNSKEMQDGNRKECPQLRASLQRPISAAASWAESITVPQPFNMSIREAQKKSQVLRSGVWQEVENHLTEKQKQEEAECQKQFRAMPAPAHVYLPLYDEIKEREQERRRVEVERRKQFLQETQKPFSFLEREEKRKEEIRQKLPPESSESTEPKPKWSKKIPLSVQDPSVSEKLKEAELYRKIRMQMRAEDLLRSSSTPIKAKTQRKELDKSSILKTKEEKLGFLNTSPKFQPQINREVPNFEQLHKALQTEAMRMRQLKEATRCKPFELHTSKLPPRQIKVSNSVHTDSKVAKSQMTSSRPGSSCKSLSTDTLPVYISDAEKKRQFAIRKSLEEKLKNEAEKEQWLKQHRMRSQTMNKSVTRRAKAMDHHKSLAETNEEQVKRHRQDDQRRMREYKMELEEMTKRARHRPYLFEQVTRQNVKEKAKQQYQKTLNQSGLDEEFVRRKGEDADNITVKKSYEEEDEEEEEEENRKSILESDAVRSITVEEDHEEEDEEEEAPNEAIVSNVKNDTSEERNSKAEEVENEKTDAQKGSFKELS
ncbi:protein FAM161B [Protopterus annectens]|uniref:protein FAM161B n=1 Tax=Protopterus annectens TaxID=7888 RepID=UPI001CFA0AF1|nr:protein FAM161B [Protopterus annectens]